MADFATPTDLRHYLGIAHDNLDMGRAKRLLTQSTAIVRGYCRQVIERVTAEAVTLTGRGETTLLLPEIPVISIASITEDAVAVSADDYDLMDGGILRRISGWWGSWTDPSTIVVTYTHGFSPLPQDVREVCLSVAGRGYTHASPSTFGLDGLQEARGFPVSLFLTAEEKDILMPYALPYALTR